MNHLNFQDKGFSNLYGSGISGKKKALLSRRRDTALVSFENANSSTHSFEIGQGDKQAKSDCHRKLNIFKSSAEK